MAQTLEALIEKEFQDVQKTREDLLAKKQEIDNQLRALDLRLQAALNYRATLEGKFAQAVTRSRKQRTKTGTRAPRGARAKLRNQIIEIVKGFPNGITAERINTELQAIDPKARQRIANLLSKMKTDGALLQEGRRSPYKLAPDKTPE